MDGSSLPHVFPAAAFDEDGDRSAAPAEAEIRFRSFRLRPGARMLQRDGEPIELGSRAFDLLHALARARGRVVSKRDIVSQVWPSTVVEESNLRFQVGVLRKALGRDRDLIKTVAGRGYIFAAEPAVEAEEAASEPRRFPVLQLVQRPRPEQDARQSPHDLLVARLAQSPEACEALHLLRAVLDELWAMTPQAAQGRMSAGPAAANASR